MTKKKYVEGNIEVRTAFFKMPEAGAYHLEKPADADPENIPTNSTKDGQNILVIDEKKPQSIFDEYYAQGEFTSYYKGAVYLYRSFKDVYDDYEERKHSFKILFDISTITEEQQIVLFRMMYLSFVTSFETFISDIIVTKILSSKDDFYTFFNANDLSDKGNLHRLKNKGLIAKWEQEVIRTTMRKSYADLRAIKKAFKSLFGFTFENTKGKLNKIFHNRHLLAHKNGRDRDDNYLEFTKSDIETLIVDLDTFVDQVMNITKKQSQ